MLTTIFVTFLAWWGCGWVVLCRGGSRGRVQGVCTPPPWDDLRFSYTTGILQKKNKKTMCFVLKYSKRRVHPLLKEILDPPLLWTPCFRIKKWYFHILVLELLHDFIEIWEREREREREFFWPIWKFRCFNFSTFAGLRVNNNFITLILTLFLWRSYSMFKAVCFQTYVHAFLALLVDTHLQFPGLQLYYLVL